MCARALATKFRCSPETPLPQDSSTISGQTHAVLPAFPNTWRQYRTTRNASTARPMRPVGPVLGTDHGRLAKPSPCPGASPPALSDAVGGHHDPERVDRQFLASLVHLADAITHALDLAGREAELVPPRIYPPCWNAAGLPGPRAGRFSKSSRGSTPLRHASPRGTRNHGHGYLRLERPLSFPRTGGR